MLPEIGVPAAISGVIAPPEVGDGCRVRLGRRDDRDLGQLVEQHQRPCRHEDEAGLVALQPVQPLGTADPAARRRPDHRSEHQHGEDVEPPEEDFEAGRREHEGRVGGLDGVEDEEERVADQLRDEAPKDDEVADAGQVAPTQRHAHQHAPVTEDDEDHAPQSLQGMVEAWVFALPEQDRRHEACVDGVRAGRDAETMPMMKSGTQRGKDAEQVAGNDHPVGLSVLGVDSW